MIIIIIYIIAIIMIIVIGIRQLASTLAYLTKYISLLFCNSN